MLSIEVNLIFYIWVFNTTIEVIIKENPIQLALRYYLEAFDQEIMVLVY
jgi:hypothetical protein